MALFLVYLSFFSVLFGGVTSAAVKTVDVEKCGVEASSNPIHQEPWLVYIEYKKGEKLSRLRCAATLIDSRHLVTAAHCVNNAKKFTKLVARLGEYDLTTEEDCTENVCSDTPIHIEIQDIIIHPSFDKPVHDIAVLRLKESAPYTEFIRPICLPSGPVGEGMKFSAGAWGEIPRAGTYSNVKKIVVLPYVDLETCQQVYKNTNLGHDVVCAGGEKGIDTCRGDSGSPLVLYGKQAELRGVTSGGNPTCGTEGYPGIYTDVFHHLEWIRQVVQEF